MHIYSLALTPQGAEAPIHRIQSVEVRDAVLVTVNSYANTESTLPLWQGTHEMPIEDLNGGVYPTSVLTFLTSDLGPFMGGVVVEDPTSLETVKAKAGVRINQLRASVIGGGCFTPSGMVDTTEVSLRNIMAAYQAATVSLVVQQPFSMVWRLLDNSDVTVDAAGMIGIGNAVLKHVDDTYRNSWVLKAAVAAATTNAEVAAISLGGWPSNTAPNRGSVMPAGLQCWDASGNLIFTTTTLTGRLIGTRVLTPTYYEEITASVSAGKTLWWHFYVQGDAKVRGYRQVTQDANQFTVECNIGAGGTSSGTAYVFYGEC